MYLYYIIKKVDKIYLDKMISIFYQSFVLDLKFEVLMV